MSGPRPPRAFIVLDLGFGDCGKGLLTDFLARRHAARLVVRFNGGAQAGHNVVTPDGRHHTFSQLGAATFVPGVRTFLSRHVIVHPGALFREAAALAEKGVADALRRVAISEHALLTTPFHQAANRIREQARGGARHGSCGVGVGETVQDALAHPEDALRAGDLQERAAAKAKLSRQRERKAAELAPLWGALPGDPVMASERRFFEQDGVLDAWLEQATGLAVQSLIVPDATLADWMREAGAVVFEGAQGVLLDETWGFHPHTTWTRCTADNALELLAEAAPAAEVERWGVLRSHAVRHGAGPLPTEREGLGSHVCEHNLENAWQGPVRYGCFDGVLARYALDVVGGVDALAVTHLDLLSRLEHWRFSGAYALEVGPPVSRLALSKSPTLEHQERLGRWLSLARPVVEECSPDEAGVLRALERLLEHRVDWVSRGPTAHDVAAPGGTGVRVP